MAKAKQKVAHGTPGSTPAGWSFWSTAARCWREWFLRYVEGLRLAKAPVYFSLGSTYGAMLEGKGDGEVASLGDEYRANMPEAKRLIAARRAGPPMGEATQIEVEHVVKDGPLAGVYTAKPDRVEGVGAQAVIREFKTAAFECKVEAERWAVNGEVIGEMLATGIDKAIVDLVTKSKNPKVLQFAVSMSDLKRKALERMVIDLREQIEDRLGVFNMGCSVDAHVERVAEEAFPRNLNSCVNLYNTCLFYDWCWHPESAGTRLAYTKDATRTKLWRKYVLGKER